MPTRIVVLYVVALLLLASCDFDKRDKAMKLSNDIIAINDSLVVYGKVWGDELKIAVNAKDFSRLPQVRADLQSFVERKILDLQTMHDVGGSEDLRKAELELLYFDKDSILPRFVGFESFDAYTPDQQIIDAFGSLQNRMRGETPKLEKVYTLLDEYAEANEFPKPTEKRLPHVDPGAIQPRVTDSASVEQPQ